MFVHFSVHYRGIVAKNQILINGQHQAQKKKKKKPLSHVNVFENIFCDETSSRFCRSHARRKNHYGSEKVKKGKETKEEKLKQTALSTTF